MKTAVEWLEEQFNNHNSKFINWSEDYFQQAKEMEKEQIIDTWNNAINAVEKDKWESFEQYYEQTYGGGEQ